MLTLHCLSAEIDLTRAAREGSCSQTYTSRLNNAKGRGGVKWATYQSQITYLSQVSDLEMCMVDMVGELKGSIDFMHRSFHSWFADWPIVVCGWSFAF